MLLPDPGPMPGRPAPPEFEQFSPDWVAAQRREDRQLARPMRLTCAGCAVLGCLAGAAYWAGLLNSALTCVAMAVTVATGLGAARAVWRRERELRSAIEAERQRVAAIRAVQQSRLAARQEQHARRCRDWQQRRGAFGRQPQWYPVSLPGDIDRIDVAGGTLAGWSALLTTIAAPRLSAGGEVTVLDLTEGAVAADLVAVASRSGIAPLVWVMPADLPGLDLGTGLGAAALADVLALAVSASDEPDGTGEAAKDAAKDAAILERVLDTLGAAASIASLTAALRALAEVDDPRADVRAGLLTAEQLTRISALFGRGAAERVVIERAWALESRLRWLEQLGSAPVSLSPSRLRVAWLDRRSEALGNKMLGSYLTVAMTHMLRQAPAGRRWEHTLCVLGAERLGGAVLDRLCDACETSGTGLVVAYRSIPARVRDRIGQGNAAVAVMRLGNAQDAKVASEQIGTEHRFVLSQLTETVGESLTGTTGDSYTSTVGTADSVSDSTSVSDTAGRSTGRGRSRHGAFAPFADFTGTASRDQSFSRASSDSVSLTEGINASTSWGVSTSRALSANTSLAAAAQRSREFLVEQHELQQLPPSAVIVTQAGPAGRRVVLADANPAIITLPTATLSSLDEARAAAAAERTGGAAAAGRARAASGGRPGAAAAGGAAGGAGRAGAAAAGGAASGGRAGAAAAGGAAGGAGAVSFGRPPGRPGWRRRRS
ncbi:MAG TPA: hypothetical protein VMK13_11195 [Streptosporangiaceae bacterium]|nr:hypothetical protein [Streptosporangiaceae bacterium]